MHASEAELNVRRAIGRSWGALLFAFFGGGWLTIAALAFGHANTLSIVGIIIVTVLLIGLAVTVQKRASKAQLGPEDESRKRDDRAFGILNAVQWAVIFLVFLLFPRIGLQQLIFPALAFVVGVHFFLMPPSYRRRSNWVVGSILCLLAVVCPLLIRVDPAAKTDACTGTVALGAGIVLWANAAWALRGAAYHLRIAKLA